MVALASALSPSDLGITVPGNEWRPGQLETAFKVHLSPKRYVLIEAPTGSGKTTIALAIAALEARENGRTYITTSTKDLQDQYLKEGVGLGIAKVMGRTNFRCEIDHSITAAGGVCTLGLPCSYAGLGDKTIPGCGYYDQLRDALTANLVIFNAAYFLAERKYPQRFPKATVLICDEAHDLRNQLSSSSSIELKKSTFDRAKLPWPNFGDNVASWVDWAFDSLQELDDHAQPSGDTSSAVTTYERANYTLANAARALLLPNSYVAKVHSHEHVEFTPLWPIRTAKDHLLTAADKVVFMTATPGDPSVFAQSLGIAPDDLDVISLPSQFSPVRRPMIYWPVSKVAGNNPSTWEPLVPAIAHILDLNENQKGLICCVSYRLGQFIANRLAQEGYGSRIMFPDPTRRSEALAEFKSSSDPKVMISPSMSMGVDLPFDQCRFVVVPKLPFQDRTDPLVIARSATKLGKALSVTDTATNLVQSYGRAMRDKDDWGSTWLLDANFDWFKNQASRDFPAWFKDAIRYYRREV